MKTKEEAIKEAWGEHYDLVKDDLNDDGQIYIDDIGFNVFDQIMILCNYDSVTELLTHPKLQGIENNNGWIRIESEMDLPKNFTNVYCLDKYGNMFICESRSKHFFCHTNGWLYNYYDFTHYQPIIKPKKPLY